MLHPVKLCLECQMHNFEVRFSPSLLCHEQLSDELEKYDQTYAEFNLAMAFWTLGSLVIFLLTHHKGFSVTYGMKRNKCVVKSFQWKLTEDSLRMVQSNVPLTMKNRSEWFCWSLADIINSI